MGLKPVSKKERKTAEEQDKADTQALILETAKPPEKSVFSRHWKLIAGTVAAGALIAGAGALYGAHKKKNGHQE